MFKTGIKSIQDLGIDSRLQSSYEVLTYKVHTSIMYIIIHANKLLVFIIEICS